MEFLKKIYSKDNHHFIFILLAKILIAFLFILTISGIVDIQNKIKQGKYIGEEIESRSTIVVSDSAEVYAKPDLALISFSVLTEKKTVAQAMTENTKQMNSVIDSIKEAGVEKEDLKTVNFNIYPRYDYIEIGDKRVLVGYEITQSLQIKIRDLDKIGEIIQKATDAGANQVSSLQFTIDNQDELREQVRKEAIDKTKDKAKKLADQLGVSLGRIIDFNEGSQLPNYDYMMEKTVGIGGGGAIEALQIEIGQNKIEVTVSIIYEIN